MYKRFLKKNIKEINYDLSKDLNYLSEEINQTVSYYQTKYGIGYIGELAEHFIEHDFIKDSKDLTTLILFLGQKKNIKETEFQDNQIKIFVRNVYKWVEKNEVSKKEYSTIFIALLLYVKTKISEDTDLYDKILDDLQINLKELEMSNYWFDICLLFNLNVFSKTNTDFMIELLNKNNTLLTDLDLNLIYFISKRLFSSKDVNIIITFGLKAEMFKKNKGILNH